MKISTATSVLYQYELRDAIPLIARCGFDGIDIWGGRPHVYRRDYSTEELLELLRNTTGEGMEISSFMPAFYRYPHSLSSSNPKVRQDSIQYMRESIDNAALLGAKIVLVVPDISLYGQSRKESLSRFIESVDIISQHALQYDLMLGLEVLFNDETDLVNSSDDALFIIHSLGKENLGVVADTGTLNLSKETPGEMCQKLNSLLLQVHVNDNHGNEKQQNLVPGEGTYDFLGLIRELKQFGYSGFLSAELSKEYASNPEPALRTTAERLRGWIQAA
jgi:fructoselysine 3-epimerase